MNRDLQQAQEAYDEAGRPSEHDLSPDPIPTISLQTHPRPDKARTGKESGTMFPFAKCIDMMILKVRI